VVATVVGPSTCICITAVAIFDLVLFSYFLCLFEL